MNNSSSYSGTSNTRPVNSRGPKKKLNSPFFQIEKEQKQQERRRMSMFEFPSRGSSGATSGSSRLRRGSVFNAAVAAKTANRRMSVKAKAYMEAVS